MAKNQISADVEFQGLISQVPGAGANNAVPFAQYGDLFSDAIVTTPTPAFPTSTTLNSTVPALDAYVLGQRVAYGGGSYTVGASTTSYLDLSNTGVLVVSTSATVTADSLRLATVTSSATAITGVTQLAPSQISYVRQQLFAANGSFTPTTGVIYVDGAAGGGGGASSQGAQAAGAGGGGGGAGQCVRRSAINVVIGHSLTIAIGAAGAGAAAGAASTAGTNGGNTTITDSVTGTVLLTLTGGTGGGAPRAGSGGPGGEGYPSGGGGASACYFASTTYGYNAGGVGGQGASSKFGGGGGGGPGTQGGAATAGSAGDGFGSGGGGASGMANNATDGAAGANGTPGFVLIQW